MKQSVIARALTLRAALPAVFGEGEYVKLEASGSAAQHVLAFARRHGADIVVTAVTRLAAGLLINAPLVPREAWGDTTLTLPGGDWIDVLNGGRLTGETISAALLFAKLPVCLLQSSVAPH